MAKFTRGVRGGHGGVGPERQPGRAAADRPHLKRISHGKGFSLLIAAKPHIFSESWTILKIKEASNRY